MVDVSRSASRAVKGVPLLIFNGIGANLECLEPLTNALDGIETIVFDLPGVGGSGGPHTAVRTKGVGQADRQVAGQAGLSRSR